jgi:hypothetical protein
MLNYINYVLEKTTLTEDVIILITNELYKNKWNTIKTKIKVRMNALSFNIMSKLLIDNIEHITTTNFNEKKEYCMKYSKPLLFIKISIIQTNKYSYKIIILENNNISNKYITYYKNGAVIWDSNFPRHSIMYNS